MPTSAPDALPAPPPPPVSLGTELATRALRAALIGLVIAVLLTLVSNHAFWPTLVYSECISMSCWVAIDGGLALATRVLNRRRAAELDEHQRSWPGWPWTIAIILTGTTAGVLVGSTLGSLIVGMGGLRVISLRGVVGSLAFSLVPAAITTYYFYSRSKLQAAQARVQAAQRQAAEHQLRLLESQLEPHMLFNTLANLRVLIALDSDRAQLMLDHLIAFLRSTLSASRVPLHPLAQEFARVADYLALMKVRMGDRLQEELTLPADLAPHPVPPMLLQPLVENAIKHGLEPHVDGGRLVVAARSEPGWLVLSVRDTGVGLSMAPAGQDHRSASGAAGGFGTSQVRERLATQYGPMARLSLQAADDDHGGGTIAEVRLPLSAVPAPAAAP